MFYVKLRENYPNDMLVLSTGEAIKTEPNPKKDNEYFPVRKDSYELRELLRQGILILKEDEVSTTSLEEELKHEELVQEEESEVVEEQPKVVEEQPKVEEDNEVVEEQSEVEEDNEVVEEQPEVVEEQPKVEEDNEVVEEQPEVVEDNKE